MNLRALYVSKLAKCPLTCLADLAGDPSSLFLFLVLKNKNQKKEAWGAWDLCVVRLYLRLSTSDK
jgi:hypothetical protein